MKKCLVFVVTMLFAVTEIICAQTCTVTTATTDHSPTLPGEVVTGDFNGDGNLDLATISDDQQDPNVLPRVSVFLNNGDGSFAAPLSTIVNEVGIAMDVGDLDNDSDLDIVIENEAQGSISILLNNGDGTFASEIEIEVPISLDFLATSGVAVGDFDSDLDLDIAVSVNEVVITETEFFTPGYVVLLTNNGDATFQVEFLDDVGDFPIQISTEDIDKDLDLDLVVLNQNLATDINGTPVPPASVSVLLNNGDGTFATPTEFITDSDPQDFAIADFNGDDNLDLVLNSVFDSVILLLPGDGVGGFEQPSVMTIGSGLDTSTDVEALDVDGDLDMDLIIPHGQDNVVTLMINDGSGSFELDLVINLGLSPAEAVMGDFDGDSRPDAAVVHTLPQTIVSMFFSCTAASPLLGDVNLDGEVDLLDVTPFVDRILTNTFQIEADINEDQEVNLLDVPEFVSLLTSG